MHEIKIAINGDGVMQRVHDRPSVIEQTFDPGAETLVVVNDVKVVAPCIEHRAHALRERPRFREPRETHARPLLHVGERLEFVRPRSAEGIVARVQVHAVYFVQHDGFIDHGVGRTRKDLHVVPQHRKFASEMTGVDALPSYVGASPIDEIGDTQRVARAREGGICIRHELSRKQPRAPQLQAVAESQSCDSVPATTLAAMSLITASMIARSHSVGEPRWSPSGKLVGWLDSWDSRTDLVIAPSDGSLPPSVVSADHAVTPIGAYGGGGWSWRNDEEIVVAGANGHLVLLRADGAGLVRVLHEVGMAAAPTVSPDGAWVAFVRERDDACEIVVVAVDGGGGADVLSTADYAWDPAWSCDSNRVAWHEWDLAQMSWQQSRIAVRDRGANDDVVVVDGRDGGVAVGQPRFSPDGSRLAWVSDRSGWWNIWVARHDGSEAQPLRNEEHDHAGPAWGPGQRTFAWSPDGTRIAYERNENGHGRLVVAAIGEATTVDLAKAFHSGIAWTDNRIVATRSGAKTPQQIVVYDATTGVRSVVARGPVAGFEECGLLEPEMISWDTSEGQRYGNIRRPPDVDRPPMLVTVHGGPTDQSIAEWNPRAAYWASRGWAVLSVNYRGSTGYGRAYREALQGEWGIADVDDVVSGIRHAISMGWCDPDRVVVTGGSAGGFTALLVCAFHGDLVRAGVSLFGVADLANLAATTHRFESTYLDGLVGLLDAHADRYRERSPVTHASRIKVPMLMLQGRDDKAVPVAQSDDMVAAMRAAGTEVEYQIYEGEGHGFRKLVNVIDEYRRTEAFLDRWAGAR
jgi:dipeptidyl aminopeptidase/acylaminoacyl peptidase